MFHGSFPIPFTHLKCAHMTTSLSSQVVQYLLLCFSILKGHHPRPTAACCQPQTLTYMLNPYRGTKRRPAGAPHLFGQSYYATSDLLLPKKNYGTKQRRVSPRNRLLAARSRPSYAVLYRPSCRVRRRCLPNISPSSRLPLSSVPSLFSLHFPW